MSKVFLLKRSGIMSETQALELHTKMIRYLNEYGNVKKCYIKTNTGNHQPTNLDDLEKIIITQLGACYVFIWNISMYEASITVTFKKQNEETIFIIDAIDDSDNDCLKEFFQHVDSWLNECNQPRP